jgi:hypothetical protein
LTPRSHRRSSRYAVVAAVTLGLLVALAGPLEARKLAVRKMPEAWTEARGRSADGESGRVDRITRAQTRLESVPEQARHGHLQLGPRLPSVLERGDLEVRPGIGRGGGVDTTVIRIAVIRVEFQTDRLGPLTTGDGRFLRVNPDPDTYFIDPAPHNDAYFAAHVEAVSRYWSSMTYGRVRFEGTVFPRNQEFGAYLLTDMADYGPRSDDELFSIEGLTNYSRESLIAADADPDLVWSEHDIYFVVHAGSDWQNDVFGDTPYDLPTFSIAFSDSDVVVTDEGDTLTTMITYPETSSQDGFLVALNGGIAHEMGHQLGLLDLYNVETFAPTVAFYDVMDSGNLASVFVPNPQNEITEVIGVLPTCPGAWSRWLVTFQLGIDPFEVTGDLPRARLRAIQSRAGTGTLPPNTQKWYRVPISDAEYFMVENRVDDLDGRYPDGAFKTALDQDDATGVVLGPITDDTEEISHNYDLLVDPGVLIWHVDERQALANLSRGRGLNVIYDKRSITIEEADGIIDIGSPYSFFPLGTDKETFHADNNGFFTPDTRPNSDSNLGTPSGISIANIGAIDSTVAMDFLLSSKPRGWPAEIGAYGTSGRTAATLADVDGDGADEVAVLGEAAAWIFRYEDTNGSGTPDPAGAWPAPAAGLWGTPEWTQTLGDLDGDGRLEIVASTDSGGVYCWQGDGTPHADADSAGLLAAFPDPNGLAWSPIPADLDRDGTDELYAVTKDGYLRGWDVVTALTERFPPRPLLGPDVDSVAVLNATIAVGDLDDDLVPDGLVAYVRSDSVQIQRFDADGRRILRTGWAIPDSLGANEQTRVWVGLADLDRRPGINDLEIVLALRNGWITVVRSTGAPVPGWPRQVLGPIAGPPAFGDLDDDGLLEIAFTANARSVHAFNYNGTEMPGWPVHVRLADHPPSQRPPSGPVIADVDGDGRQDVVAGFADFTIRAIAPDGREAAGFPIPAGAPVISPPAISDANGDGRLDLFVQCLDGSVYARILRGLAGPRNPQWPMIGGGPALHGSFDPARLPQVATVGSDVLEGPVVIFPNPVRGTDDEVRIRYTLGPLALAATRVEISLYNVAGERVRSLEGTIFPNTENVVTVPSAELASGVYICSIRARSGDHEETSTEKFAVIR